jgi:predicted nucleotidyltransferase component of viral defense system
MNPAIASMLATYGKLSDIRDEENALKEIIQKICLRALQREGFFTKAAFYGGTALRIMYGLQRFSEDLDFCLETPDPEFRWITYKKAVETELKTYGFDAEFEAKKDDSESAVGSAFVKQSTLKGLLLIESRSKASKAALLKVRLELDKSNPPGATYEEQFLRQPELFRIRTLDQSSLYAGKMHAIIARQYKNRVKGRDYFDLLFYIQNNTKVNLNYLSNKLRDSGHINSDVVLDENMLRNLYLERIETVNFQQAVQDVSPYLNAKQIEALKEWNTDYFKGLAPLISGA